MSNRLLESGDELLIENGSFRLLEELFAIVFGPLLVCIDPGVHESREPGVAVSVDPDVAEAVLI